MVDQNGGKAGRLIMPMLRSMLVLTLLATTLACTKRPAGDNGEGGITPGLHITGTTATEDAGSLRFGLLLEPARSSDVTVDYSLSSATGDPNLATANVDFAGQGGSVTITAGEQLAVLSIALTDDAIYERTETFTVTLSNAQGAEITTSSATGTILDNDPKPVASLSFNGDTTIPEQFGEQRSFSISLDRASSLDSMIMIRHSATGMNPQAYPRMDYQLSQAGSRLDTSATITIPAGQTTLSTAIDVEVVDDGEVEGNEDSNLALYGVIDLGQTEADVDIHASNGSVDVTITDNDGGALVARKLNDSGVTDRYEATGFTFPGQDADYGRDKAAAPNTGFSFTKLDADGNPLPDDASSWDCVLDNVTGLVWEVKQTGFGLRGAERKFRWYNPDNNQNGGVKGQAGIEACDNATPLPSLDCNVHYYAADMNLFALCGRTGWRIPNMEELRSLGDYSPNNNSAISGAYFPNDPSADGALAAMWSSMTYAGDPEMAWVMRFADNLPADDLSSKTDTAGVSGRNYLRLVTEDNGS